MKKFVIMSDLHRQFPMDLPKGDILICAGDFDIRDQFDLDHVINYFIELPYNDIIFTSGNHDIYMEQLFKMKTPIVMPNHIHYLANSSVEIDGIKFWGSPFSPIFGNWSFMENLPTLRRIWSKIPEDTDVVITHAPPFGINDRVRGISQGCPGLRDRIKEIKPKLHCHAHIHEGHGVYQDEHTIYVNGSLMNEYYELVNKPVVINYEN